MKDLVIERYKEQNTKRLEIIEAQLAQLLAELGQLKEVIESVLQMIVVVHEQDKD